MTVAACVWFSSCSRSSSSLIEVFSKVVSSTSPEALFSSALLIDCSIALDSGCVLFSAGLEQPAILNAVNSATSAICALLKIDFFPLLPLLPVNETESVPPWLNGLLCLLFATPGRILIPSTFAEILKSDILSPVIDLFTCILLYKTTKYNVCIITNFNGKIFTKIYNYKK